MKFAIDLPNYGKFGDPAFLLDLAIEAEAAGWDGFFLWDHLIPGGRTLVTDPWVVMAAIAVRTERIAFGPMVTPLARRRMNKLARETVALDRLSGGRLIMGVGLGQLDDREFSAFGDEGDRRARGRILDESLDVLAGLWSGEAFTYRGAYLQVKTAPFQPTSLQRPRIPIWVAGLWPNKKPMRRAAAWDGAFPIDRRGDLTEQLSLRDMADAIAYVLGERTVDQPFDVVHAGLSSGDRSQDVDLVRQYGEIGVTWWLEHVYPSRWSAAQLRRFIRGGPPRDD